MNKNPIKPKHYPLRTRNTMSKPKITQDKLKEELEKGKTYKQIAYNYGYGYPSRALSEKMREIGYRKLETLNQRDKYGGTQLYVNGDLIDEAIKEKDLQDCENICRKTFVNEKGNIEHELTEKEWSKEEE